MKKLEILIGYNDLELNRAVGKGETLIVTDLRSEKLLSMGLAKVLIHDVEEDKPVEDLSEPLKTPSGVREEKEEPEEEATEVAENPIPSMGYRDLQKLAKEHDIQANQSKEVLIEELTKKLQ